MNNSAYEPYLEYMERRSGCFDEDLPEEEGPTRTMSFGWLHLAWCAAGGALWWFLIRVGIVIWRLL